MKSLLMIVGALALIAGVFFALQGAGYIHWPPVQPGQFTMVDNKMWIYYGGGIAVFGLILIMVSRR
ncbi:MAG: hypothetical protein HY243_03060 [Proteobacteria bacterium]|nr:hypothetical protein [Pseudomonadota bacterium]